MEEFTNLINHCKQMYEDTPFCDTCPMTQCFKGCRNDCYNCLAHIHRITTKDKHYTCEKITYNYILKHAHRYASEISWAVWNSRSLFNLEQPLKVASVGSVYPDFTAGKTTFFKKRSLLEKIIINNYFTFIIYSSCWLYLTCIFIFCIKTFTNFL